MPCAVDYILEGLAKNLELERELGAFSLEFDRELLLALPKEQTAKSQSATPATSATSATPLYDYVFLHHGPLAGPGVEMMANVVKAMKLTPEKAPIVFTGEKPPAKIYVVLGAKALNKWYEGVSLAQGGWFKDVDSEVLLVYSPEEIYRFGTTLTPAVKRMKLAMWNSLKEAMRRVS